MLILSLPIEYKKKLTDAGFDKTKTLDDHQEVWTHLLGVYNMTPLTYAVKIGDLALVEMLIDYKVNINLRDDSFNLTPLMWAAWYGRKKIADCLLRNHADSSLTGKIPSYPDEMTAYEMTKAHSYCSFTSLWYTAQKYVGEGDLDKTRKTLKYR